MGLSAGPRGTEVIEAPSPPPKPAAPAVVSVMPGLSTKPRPERRRLRDMPSTVTRPAGFGSGEVSATRGFSAMRNVTRLPSRKAKDALRSHRPQAVLRSRRCGFDHRGGGEVRRGAGGGLDPDPEDGGRSRRAAADPLAAGRNPDPGRADAAEACARPAGTGGPDARGSLGLLRRHDRRGASSGQHQRADGVPARAAEPVPGRPPAGQCRPGGAALRRDRAA